MSIVFRRKTQKVKGTRNEYQIVNADDYITADETFYKDFYYYSCKHRKKNRGHLGGNHENAR